MKTNAKSKSNEAQRIVTPEFRAAFVHVHKVQEYLGKKSYSIVMLVSKKKDISKYKLAIEMAIRNQWPKKSERPTELINPILDGDSAKFEKYQGYKGHWAIKASTGEDYKPEVIGEDGEEIISPSDFYPGCYARAEVYARAFDVGDNQGVHFILNSVMKTKDGTPFGGKKAAKDVFASYLNESGEESNESEGEEEEDFT